jgi:fatty acid/phospholipid biosynthesis enzyme
MISHGSSGPRAITNAIRSAKQVVASGVNETIIQRIGGSTE